MPGMIRINWRESVPAVTVRFIAPWSIYNAGEVAGFTGAIAASLIDAGVAIYVEHPVSPPAETQAPRSLSLGREMTKEEELEALGVDTSTKEDTEEEMKRKALRRPSKDKMIKGSQIK